MNLDQEKTSSDIEKKTCILVIGMYCSGTSSLTRAINLAVATLPQNLMGDPKNNPTSYWETISIREANETLLKRVGSSWDDIGPINFDDLASGSYKSFKETIQVAIDEKRLTNEILLIEDPRICRTCACLIPALKDLGIRTKVIFSIRNPIEVSLLLQERDNMSISYSHLLWMRNMLEAERFTRGCTRMFIDYNSLLDDWKIISESINNRLNLNLQISSEANTLISQSLLPALRRQRTEDAVHICNDKISQRSTEIFNILLAAAENPAVLETNREYLDKEYDIFNQEFNSTFLPVKKELDLRKNRLDKIDVTIWAQEDTISQVPTTEKRESNRSTVFEQQLRSLYDKLYEEAFRYGEKISQLEVDVHFKNVALMEKDAVLSELESQKAHSDSLVRESAKNMILQEDMVISLKNQIALLNSQFDRINSELISTLDALKVYKDNNNELIRQIYLLESSFYFKFKSIFDDEKKFLTYAALDPRLVICCLAWAFSFQLKSKLQYRKNAIKDLDLIRASKFFNAQWYTGNYEDLNSVDNPELHYLLYGGRERRHPGPMFDAEAYALSNPDLSLYRNNPLLHYLHSGCIDDRPVQPVPGSTLYDIIDLAVRTESFDLVGYSGLDVVNGHLLSTGIDPQLRFRLSSPLKRGVISIEVEIVAPKTIQPKFYFSFGSEYLEDISVVVKHSQGNWFHALVYLDRDVTNFRFDPFDCEGEVILKALHLRRAHTIKNSIFRLGLIFSNIRRIFHFGAKNNQASYVAYDVQPSALSVLKSKHSNWATPSWSDPKSFESITSYNHWIKNNDYHCKTEREAYRVSISRCSIHPMISIIMTTFETPEPILRAALDSVLGQIYENWELCIADDGSSSQHVRTLLEDYAAADPRISIDFRDHNGGISAASNSAFALAQGEWIALLDHDDVLREHALAEIVAVINNYPNAEIIYSDEDKITGDTGVRFEPFFKPGFSIDLLRSQNYFNHLTIHKTANIRQVGGWRSEFDGSQDYDLNLRIVEIVDHKNILHIPKILYHWRATELSVATSVNLKTGAVEAGRRAVAEHIIRQGTAAEIILAGPNLPFNRVVYSLPVPPPLISIIIPTKNRYQLLKKCIESIIDKTSIKHFEIIVVDNESHEIDAVNYLKKISHIHNVSVVHFPGEFNYSAMNNHAVRYASGRVLCLLNNDIEVINSDWLRELSSHALRPEVGCVGAMLLYPDNTVQHAGVVLGVGSVAGHSHKHMPSNEIGYFARTQLCHNLSAVTGACLVVRSEIYNEVEGLDENNLHVAFNDVDFCLKVYRRGYINVFTPFAELFHHESASRGTDDTSEKKRRFNEEVDFMISKWGHLLDKDLNYSPNLTLKHENYSYSEELSGKYSIGHARFIGYFWNTD